MRKSPSDQECPDRPVEYLSLGEAQMDKWPGVDPETDYDSAMGYKVMQQRRHEDDRLL